MTPQEVKELLITVIAEQKLPISIVDILPNVKSDGKDLTTEARIKDVIHQWNSDGKIHTQPPGEGSIMEFYTKTDANTPLDEFLDYFKIVPLLETVIIDKEMAIKYTDYGFRLVTLHEGDTSRYPIKILHGGFRIEKTTEEEINTSQLKSIANRFEMVLKENQTKAKLLHRGFKLEKETEQTLPLAQVKQITKLIDETLNINYVMDSYNFKLKAGSEKDALKDPQNRTECHSANIRISCWRYKHRHW